MEKHLSSLTELNFEEVKSISGGDDHDRRLAGVGSAIVGVTMLAVAATPVGWVLCVGGILAIAYSD